jgi:hypothetical protein
MSKYTLRASSRGAWRVNWSAEALGLGGAARGAGGDGEEADAAPPTPEERAAAGVGLDAAFPSRAERRAFPELLGRRRGVQTYLAVRCGTAVVTRVATRALRSGADASCRHARRNKLLLAWEADVSKLLSAKAAGASAKAANRGCTTRCATPRTPHATARAAPRRIAAGLIARRARNAAPPGARAAVASRDSVSHASALCFLAPQRRLCRARRRRSLATCRLSSTARA